MIGSQEIPTRAAPPPGAVLKNRGDQCCSSPTTRRMVMPRAIRAGTVTRLVMETDFVSVMEPPDPPIAGMTPSPGSPSADGSLPSSQKGRGLRSGCLHAGHRDLVSTQDRFEICPVGL